VLPYALTVIYFTYRFSQDCFLIFVILSLLNNVLTSKHFTVLIALFAVRVTEWRVSLLTDSVWCVYGVIVGHEDNRSSHLATSVPCRGDHIDLQQSDDHDFAVFLVHLLVKALSMCLVRPLTSRNGFGCWEFNTWNDWL